MSKNLKIFVFIMSFLMIISIACGATPTPAPTPTEIPTEVPTQTPLPTYTPMPTYTPYPTATKEPTLEPTYTDVPEENIYEDLPAPGGIEPVECPNADFPEGAKTAECYSLDNKALGVIYFDAYNNVWGIAAAWFSEDDEVAYTAGEFLAWAGVTHGWNGDDIVGAIKAIKEPDKWYTYGSVKSKITLEEGKVALVLKPSGK